MTTDLAKKCNVCGEVKPIELFARSCSCLGGYRTDCRVCQNATNTLWRNKNREHIAKKNLAYNTKRAALEGRSYVPTGRGGRRSPRAGPVEAKRRHDAREKAQREKNMAFRVPPCCVIHREHDHWRHFNGKTRWVCLLCDAAAKLLARKIPPPMPHNCPEHGHHTDWTLSPSHVWWCDKCTRQRRTLSRKRRRQRLALKYCPAHPVQQKSASALKDSWYAKNRDSVLRKAKERYRARKQSHPIIAVKDNIRHRVRLALRSNPMRTFKLIGCQAGQLRDWLQSQFTKSMTWQNYGKAWVVDHIHPLASFDLTDRKQLLQACHYTNLRPLLRWKNAAKGAQITVPQMPLMLPMSPSTLNVRIRSLSSTLREVGQVIDSKLRET